jgi:hypothetical protein
VQRHGIETYVESVLRLFADDESLPGVIVEGDTSSDRAASTASIARTTGPPSAIGWTPLSRDAGS